MANWLENATVIITGASGGIGKEIAIHLIQKYNCKVIGIARNEEKIKSVIEELGDKSENFSYQLFDVSKEDNWKDFSLYLENNGICPDILINNAGILPKFNKFGNYSVEYIRSAMGINFYASVYSMHYIMPLLLKSDKAAVINVSSSAALCSLAGTSVYTASKAALKGLTEAAREEYRGECYIGLVCPGFTKTDIFSSQGEISGNENRLIEAVSSSCDTIVRKIVHGISVKKELMIYGTDAKLMHIGSKVAAVKTSLLSSKVMKASKAALFADVFRKDKK